VQVNRILAVAHSGSELYVPHKSDLGFYNGQQIIIKKLGLESDLVVNTVGKIERRHLYDDEIQHLDLG